MLGDFVTSLQKTYEVRVATYPTDTTPTYSELAKLVLQLAPTEEPYAIIAESFSGPIATLIAHANPSNLRAVVFVASFVRNPTALPKFFRHLANIPPMLSPTLVRLARPFTFGRWGTHKLDASLAKATEIFPSDVLASRIHQVMKVNELEKFGSLEIPMLYIRPTHDRLVGRKVMTTMKATNAILEVVEMEGPHFILQVKPNECANTVTAFLKDLATKTTATGTPATM